MKHHRLTLLAVLASLLLSITSLSAQGDAFPMTIEHEVGETTIEAVPERIVVLEYSFADHLGTLGIAPVGFAVDAPPDYIYEYTSDVGAVEVGTRAEPNLEAILELNPDLIIGDLRRHEGIYDQLSLIAPTVIFNSLRGSYEDQLEQFSIIATILDKEEAAANILASYQEHFDATRATTNADAGEFVVGVLHSGGFTAHSNQSFMGSFLESLGRTNALEPQQEETQYLLDMEGFAAVNPGTIVILCNPADQQYFDDMADSPLWQAFDAVTNNRVYVFDRNLWSKGRGVTAYEKILADSVNSGLLADTESQSTVCGGSDLADEELSDRAFPVTIDHQFGTTVINEAPQRIVSIGYTEQDYLLALGEQPVAVRYWYGDEDDAIFPWAQDKVEGDPPIVLNMTYGSLNYEAILALEPDLISAVTAGITEEEYNSLSQIAPTITQSADYINFGMPWQETMQMIGDAVGKSDLAASIVADTEALFADAIADNPEFEGKAIAIAYAFDGTYGFYTSQDSRGRFFTDLGFVIPDELIDVAGDSFYADISAERIDLLDQDVIAIVNLQFIEGGVEALESDPLFSQLEAVQNGNVIYLDENAENALGFSSPLSLAYAIDAAVPQLQAILGGADSTVDISCETGFRGVVDAVGNGMCLPEQPERIVSLTDGDTDSLVALGVEAVGISNGRGSQTPPRYLLDDLPADYVSVGTFYSPSLEIVLGLEPDLILFSYGDYAEPELLEQLNAIAPVYITVSGDGTWRDLFDGVGDALNMAAGVDAFLADFDNRVADLGEYIDPETQAIVARWAAEGPQVMAPHIFAPSILQALGFAMPDEIPDLQAGHPHSAPLSLEAVDILDVDWAFVGTLQAEGDAVDALQTVFDNPLFQQLEVVQNDQVVVIDGSVWTSSGGPIAAEIVLNDVEAALLGGE